MNVFKTLEALKNLPYGGSVASKVVSELTSGKLTQEKAMNIVTDEFRTHLKTLSPDKRFDAFKDVQKIASGLMSKDATAKMDGLMGKLDKLPADLKESLGYAITENNHLADYLINKGTSAGNEGSGFVDSAIDGLYNENDKGEMVIDGQKAKVLKDIFVSMGDNPDKNFGAEIDAVGKSIKTHEAAVKANDPAAIQLAERDMYKSLRAAGAGIPFFAGAEFNMSMIVQFLKDIFTPGGGGFKTAFSNLANNMGVEGEQKMAMISMGEMISDVTSPTKIPQVIKSFKNGTLTDDAKGLFKEAKSNINVLMGNKETNFAVSAKTDGKGLESAPKDMVASFKTNSAVDQISPNQRAAIGGYSAPSGASFAPT